MSKANAEQKLAIHHHGGVLLKAGAGSGKTFVLVEHIIHLTSSWILSYKQKPVGSFEEYIRKEFSQIIMMTFTKKAAGEMSIRLSDKFTDFAAKTEVDKDLWQIASDSLPLLTVTTIDGFCRRLITSGYFPHLSTEAKIIFRTERLDQVKLIFEEWFMEITQKLPQEILDIVIREKSELLKSFCSIFSDSSLRLQWKKFGLDQVGPQTLGKVLHESFLLNKMDDELAKIHLLDLPSESERKGLEQHVGTFQATGLPVVDSVEKLTIYFNLFANIARLTKQPAATSTPAHVAAHEGLGELRKWVKDWMGPIQLFQEHFTDKVTPWLGMCQDLFSYIEKRLDPNLGMTFADIEYYVALGLEEAEQRKRIQETYKYFIVDEFQDTSSLQFKIIKDLIGNDFNRLFCVGDPKQAIYGFRGGELSVFQDCSEMVSRVLTLANNYRSLPDVINFNNSLFASVLPLGKEFSGTDLFTVEAEGQNVPEEVGHTQAGEIEVIGLTLEAQADNEKKLSWDDVNLLESLLLSRAIEQQRISLPDEVCTILYRKLGPSVNLIRDFIKKKIGFTAQFKIELLDDPIMGIFLILLRRHFDANEKTKDKTPEFMIRHYLSILGIEDNLVMEFKSFDEDVKFWGLLEAFKKFIFHLNITNENSDINLDMIETLCKLYHQDPESILIELSSGESQKVSLDFRFGESADKVQVMTAHASKGLEFDNVYLGGIYTNGFEMAEKDLFGNRPSSFYFYLDLQNREKIKSPHYIHESDLNAFKNFSESKRLFYVACTRAKQKLVWINIDGLEDMTSRSLPKSSWIFGLTHWMNNSQDADLLKRLKFSDFGKISIEECLSGQSTPDLPLFFFNPVGIFPRKAPAGELAIAAELSVTRLNSLIDCPRKFYLENILKLAATVDDVSKPVEKKDFQPDVEEVVAISSSSRGTLVHEYIARGIERNFIVPREAFGGELHRPIEWALQLLSPMQQEFEFVAEKPVKFKFFNFMISGIPDLILMPKGDQNAQVWDFKTGKMTETSLAHYWIQLKTYAYALYVLKQVPLQNSIELQLCFVDQQKNLSMTVTWDSIQEELFQLWSSQNQPWMIKTDHCSRCSYGDICPR